MTDILPDEMPDIQNEEDLRAVPLEKVGIKNLEYPIAVSDKLKGTQRTVASADLFVSLPHNRKGTHMSRFVEVFHSYCGDISMKRFPDMLKEIRISLNAEKAYGEIRFPFFLEKRSPVSGAKSIMNYRCAFEGEISKDSGRFFICAEVPVTTLCPCSKAISSYGAHNQRGRIKIKALYSEFFWIEELIAVAENCASGGVYSILKRPDEKYVTEHAYDNPCFVEDIVRETVVALESFPPGSPFKWFCVEAENYESIHNHNAYAYTEFGKIEDCKLHNPII